MNERYLFRGKRKDNGKLICGRLLAEDVIVPNGQEFVIEGEEMYIQDFKAYEVIPETVGQCTGLKDKNGKLIFEGDVVNVNTNKDNLCHRYEGKRLVVKFDEYHRFIASGRLGYPLCNHYEWEVIGNIHDNDNTELLEVE